MVKVIPECPPIPKDRHSRKETRDYQIQIVTPMFGGGVVAGETDLQTPIRGTSIRGQLRQWWRLIFGLGLGEGMWQREEEVFGSTAFPSPLSVVVAEQPQIQLVEADSGDRFGPVAYALFSAKDKHRVVQAGGKFRFQVSWETPETLATRRSAQNARRKKERKKLLPAEIADIGGEVEAAIRAWLAYGGIGARSRRGCGALYCQMPPQSSPPSIPGRVLIGPRHADPIEAWKASVSAYQTFRQSPRGKKHSKSIQSRSGLKTIQVPGRSHWPEADSIRCLTGCSLKPGDSDPTDDIPADQNPNDHSQPVVPVELIPAFPKGVLGLPIIFQFADGPGKNAPGNASRDPKDVQLVAVKRNSTGAVERVERMLSPVLTRPISIDGAWHSSVVIFDTIWPREITLRIEGKSAKAGGADLSYDIPMNRVVNPSFGALRPMRGKASAIESLVDFLLSTGFKEVTR